MFLDNVEWFKNRVIELVEKQQSTDRVILPENANFFVKMMARQIAKTDGSDQKLKAVIGSCFDAGFSTFNPTPKDGEDLCEVHQAVKKKFS